MTKRFTTTISRNSIIPKEAMTMSAKDDVLLPLPFEKWPILATTLKKDWPAYAEYYSFVQNSIKWASKEPDSVYSIYCPGGDHNSGVFVAKSPISRFSILVFAHEGFEELLHKIVTETKIIDWTESVKILAVDSRIISTVHSIIETLKQRKRVKIVWNFEGNCFFQSKECASMEVRVPEGYYLDTIDTSYVPLIHSLCPLHDELPELSTKFIKTLLSLNGGLGLFSKENNELVSWILQAGLGELSMAQTIEKCKRKGYAKVVVTAFAKKLAEKEVDSIAFVRKGNLPSESMFSSLKWKPIHPYCWIKTTALKNG